MTEEKIGRLKVELYENTFSPDSGERLAQIILQGRLGLEGLAADVAKSADGLNPEFILGILKLAARAAILRVAGGWAVDCGVCHIYPTVTGSFAPGAKVFHPEINRVKASYRPTLAMNSVLETVDVEVAGDVVAGPVIASVEDMLTREHNRTVTPRRNICLRGTRIRIVENESRSGMRFTSIDGRNTVDVEPHDIIINEASTVVALVPDLPEGMYFVEITTAEGNGRFGQALVVNRVNNGIDKN